MGMARHIIRTFWAIEIYAGLAAFRNGLATYLYYNRVRGECPLIKTAVSFN
jgi:hypothetical protein